MERLVFCFVLFVVAWSAFFVIAFPLGAVMSILAHRRRRALHAHEDAVGLAAAAAMFDLPDCKCPDGYRRDEATGDCVE
jgi:hypothetical protein